MTSTEQQQSPAYTAPSGGDFMVTITHTVHLRVDDPGAIAEALGMSPTEALVEVADVLGVKGLSLDELDALPLAGSPVVRVDRVTDDVDRIESYVFTDGRTWTVHVPAEGPDVVPTSGPMPNFDGRRTFVVTDGPLSVAESLAVRDLIRTAATAGQFGERTGC